VEAEKRVVGLKAAWVKTRVTERKQDKAQDAELNRQRSRALPHTHKVAGLRKAAFEKQLRQQHHARTVSRQNQEAALFRQLFVEAVEREKEVRVPPRPLRPSPRLLVSPACSLAQSTRSSVPVRPLHGCACHHALLQGTHTQPLPSAR
jgi:hypothetical protein